MGAFDVFQIVEMVANHATHHIKSIDYISVDVDFSLKL